jgi:stage VI sporulation protein D
MLTQLRFDISEKVRLHPQQPEIGTLLELDLYPDVKIQDEGQHLKIQGYLRLNGTYLGEELQMQENEGEDAELNSYEIAYVIPVEITLPADRAELQALSAEIESFDYHVLSPFELEIEAVLMIDGILPEPVKEQQVTATEETPSFSADKAQISEEAEEEEFQETAEAQLAVPNEPAPEMSNHEAVEEGEQSLEVVEEMEAEAALPTEQASEAEETTESLDRKDKWSYWLMGNKEETFTPLRMVIVKENETIELIAAKYEVPVERIMEANQLQTDRLVAGQILRIPSKQ